MKLEVLFSPEEIENEFDLREKAVVVVDILRTTSAIATAIHNGVRQIIPVASVSDAMRVAREFQDDSTVLCGERFAKLIDGFDLDNSPAAYSSDKVRNRTLIHTSTNGSAAILKARVAKSVVIGAFVNVSAVVDAVQGNDQILVLCAGNQRRFSFEDALCGGMIVSMLVAQSPTATLSDGARWARTVYDACSDSVMSAVRSCDHARTLDDAGLASDVTFCATVDVFPDVPVFDGTVIRRQMVKSKW